MSTVVFVAPFFSPAASQMIEAAGSLSGVRLGVVAQEPVERLPRPAANVVAGHWRVDDVTDDRQLEWAVRALGDRLGPVQRLFGAYEQAQLPLARVRERLGIPGLSSQAAEAFRDKALMKERLRAAGVPVARHRLLGSRADAVQFAGEAGFPLVIKPPDGAGARATHRVDDAATLDRLCAHYDPSPERPLLAEEFLHGTEGSIDSVSIDGRVVWHSITRYDPSPLHVVDNPWIQWGVLLPREGDGPAYEDIRAVIARALPALGMATGVSHAEWFRRPDGSIAVSEIAARPPGAQFTTMISRAHDVDFVRDWCRLMVDGTFTPPRPRHAVGTAYLRGQGSGTVRAVLCLDEVDRTVGHLVCDRRLPAPGQRPTGSYEGEGFIMLRHAETAVVEAALRHVISTVRVVLG